MKPGGFSTLNPYAAAYIPLSKRDSADRIENPGWTVQGGNPNVWYGSAKHNAQIRQNDKGPISVPEMSMLKSQSGYGSYGSSSQNSYEMTGKQNVDEEFEMDLEYLRINFPGISDESLTGVYMANKGDIDAAIDMLNQLEVNFLSNCFVVYRFVYRHKNWRGIERGQFNVLNLFFVCAMSHFVML